VGVLDILSLSSIASFFGSVLEGRQANSSALLLQIFDYFGVVYSFDLMAVICITAIVSAGSLRLLSSYVMSRLSWSVYAKLSSLIFEKAKGLEFQFFSDERQKTFKREILNDTISISQGIVFPCLTIVSQGIICLILISSLLVFDFKIAGLTIFFVGFVFFGVNYFIRRKLISLGNEKMKSDSYRVQLLDGILLYFKSFWIIRALDLFHLEYAFSTKRFERANALQQFLRSISRPLFEIIFLPLLVFLLVLIQKDDQLVFNIESFALFCLFAIRLMPISSTITQSIGLINFNTPILDNLLEFLGSTQSQSQRATLPIKHDLKLEKVLLEDVSFGYKHGEYVFSNVHLSFVRGNWYRIRGGSGSGKTTLVDLICGALQPCDGSVNFVFTNADGIQVVRNEANVSYVGQFAAIVSGSLLYNICLENELGNCDIAKLNRAMSISGLDKCKDLPLSKALVTGGTGLSGGQGQRVAIARGLYMGADIFVFDEITSNIDSKGKQDLITSLKNELADKIVLYISHDELIDIDVVDVWV